MLSSETLRVIKPFVPTQLDQAPGPPLDLGFISDVADLSQWQTYQYTNKDAAMRYEAGQLSAFFRSISASFFHQRILQSLQRQILEKIEPDFICEIGAFVRDFKLLPDSPEQQEIMPHLDLASGPYGYTAAVAYPLSTAFYNSAAPRPVYEMTRHEKKLRVVPEAANTARWSPEAGRAILWSDYRHIHDAPLYQPDSEGWKQTLRANPDIEKLIDGDGNLRRLFICITMQLDPEKIEQRHLRSREMRPA